MYCRVLTFASSPGGGFHTVANVTRSQSLSAMLSASITGMPRSFSRSMYTGLLVHSAQKPCVSCAHVLEVQTAAVAPCQLVPHMLVRTYWCTPAQGHQMLQTCLTWISWLEMSVAGCCACALLSAAEKLEQSSTWCHCLQWYTHTAWLHGLSRV